MRLSTQQFFQQNITNMQERLVKLNEYQTQIASGKRILAPSDDPAAASRVLEINNSINATVQFQENAGIATSRLEQEEGVLSGATQTLQRVRELVLQGRNATLTASDRGFLASEVRIRLDELLGMANTRSSNGEYIFAGNQAKTQAFTQDASGTVNYNGDQGQRQLQISADRQIADGDNGREVFVGIRNGNGTFSTAANNANTGTARISAGSVLTPGSYQPDQFEIRFTSGNSFDVVNVTTATTVAAAQPYTDSASITAIPGIEVALNGAPAAGDVFTINPSASQSMFATLGNIIAGLTGNQGSTGDNALFQQQMDNALVDIDQSIEKLLEVRASIGARLKAVDSQIEVNDEFQFQMKSVRSQLEDADLAEVISQLTLESTALQAVQQSFVKTQELNLFNFI